MTMPESMSAKQIESEIGKIQAAYDIGVVALETFGPHATGGSLIRFAEQSKLNPEKVRKLRMMAQIYSQDDLDDWYDVFRESQYALTVSHFVKFVSVSRKATRDQLTKNALKNHWSSHELQKQILAKQGRRKQAGRPPKLSTEKDVKQKLQQQFWSWNRWIDAHLEMLRVVDPKMARHVAKLQTKLREIERLASTKKPKGS
jgi:hypothetical protein